RGGLGQRVRGELALPMNLRCASQVVGLQRVSGAMSAGSEVNQSETRFSAMHYLHVRWSDADAECVENRFRIADQVGTDGVLRADPPDSVVNEVTRSRDRLVIDRDRHDLVDSVVCEGIDDVFGARTRVQLLYQRVRPVAEETGG